MSLVIFLASIILMLALSFRLPTLRVGPAKLDTYWTAPMVGAVLLLAFGLIAPTTLWEALTSDAGMNPLKILTLFLSMTALSVALDELGLFAYLASIVLRFAGTHQMRLFVSLYLMVSVLTVFTSNDVIILTFTPFIIYFSKNANIDPLPYLFAEFVAANTWSMFLIIGNPTNIYLASALSIGFAEYMKAMALPTLAGGLVSFLMLYILFQKKLRTPMRPVVRMVKIRFLPLLIWGSVLLLATTLLLALSSYISVPMWRISLTSSVVLLLSIFLFIHLPRKEKHILPRTLMRIPWQLAPFLLSMFTLVTALEETTVFEFLANTLHSLPLPGFTYGIASALSANFVNNIPMSILYGSLLGAVNAGSLASYAAVIGSNLGALFTPIGALAGMMWSGMLSSHGIRLSFGKFAKYGTAVALPSLLASLLVLTLTI